MCASDDGGDGSGVNRYRRQQRHGSGGAGGDGGGDGDRLMISTIDDDEDDHLEDDDDHHHRRPDGNGGFGGAGGARNSGGDKGGGHDHHSHGLGAEGDAVWVRLALLLALSVHSVMEGLGVGAKATRAYSLLFAIGVHKVGAYHGLALCVKALAGHGVLRLFCRFLRQGRVCAALDERGGGGVRIKSLAWRSCLFGRGRAVGHPIRDDSMPRILPDPSRSQ